MSPPRGHAAFQQAKTGRTDTARVTRFHHRRRRLTDVDLERINQIVVLRSLSLSRYPASLSRHAGDARNAIAVDCRGSERQAGRTLLTAFSHGGAKKTCHNI